MAIAVVALAPRGIYSGHSVPSLKVLAPVALKPKLAGTRDAVYDGARLSYVYYDGREQIPGQGRGFDVVIGAPRALSDSTRLAAEQRIPTVSDDAVAQVRGSHHAKAAYAVARSFAAGQGAELLRGASR